MRPLKEKISITIDSDLLEKVRDEAENRDRKHKSKYKTEFFHISASIMYISLFLTVLEDVIQKIPLADASGISYIYD